MEPKEQQPRGPEADAAGVLGRNIRALIARRRREERARSVQDRIVDAVTRFAGSMAFVYLHLILFATWITVGLGGTPLPGFDPSLVKLAMAASVEAIFLSTFILITQNRMSAQADRRADLDLHISLLAEHEVTRLITLVDAIAARMEIAESADPHLEELKQDVRPEEVMDEIERRDEERP